MRGQVVLVLLLLLVRFAWAQTAPAGWKVVRDAKRACQIAVPPEWDHWTDGTGAAVLQSPTTAIAIVTSQAGQTFKPLTEAQKKMFGIAKEKLFENTAKRLFYQDKTSNSADDANAYSASVPGNAGTCSCRVVFLPSIPEETVRKILLSLGPAPEPGL